jgi:hypothetical protein
VQRQSLADHLAKLLDRLGLDRVPRRVQTLHDVLDDYRASAKGAARATTESEGENPPAVVTRRDEERPA